MTTHNFTEAARAEAEKRWPRTGKPNAEMHPVDWLDEGMASGFYLGAVWARDRLAAQEPTDAEVLAALNADYALRFGPSNRPADSLEPYGDEAVRIMRAALTAAKEARR